MKHEFNNETFITAGLIRIILKLFFTVCIFFLSLDTSICYGANYYWVNNSGNWSDFSNHWAVSSGGSTFYSQPPTSQDDVYFDGNSFSSNTDTLTIDSVNFCCHSMSWNSALPVSIKGFSAYYSINIYGSLNLVPGLNWLSPNMQFMSSGSDSVDLANNFINASLVFYGTGQWKILSDVKTTASVNMWQGTINFKGHNINCDFFSNDPTRHQVINADSCSINCNVWATAYPNNHSASISAISSVINCNSFSCTDGNQIFHVVNAPLGFTSGDSCQFDTVRSERVQMGSSRINYLNVLPGSNNIFSCGSNASIGYGKFEGHNQQMISGNLVIDSIEFDPGVRMNLSDLIITINHKIVLNGTCAGMAYVYTNFTGKFKKTFGTVTFNYVRFRKITATGGATFNATNSFNEWQSTGINFTNPPRDTLYWINGSGHWSDPNHWSSTSGGSPASCIPHDLTDVYFDVNSFTTANDTVFADADKTCHNFNWINNQPHVIIDSSIYSFEIYGSMDIDPSILWKIHAPVNIISDSIVSLNSGNIFFLNDVRFDSTGTLNLMSDFNANATSYLRFAGNSFNTNSFSMNCGNIYLSPSPSGIINLGNSQIICESFDEGAAPNHMQSGNSYIYCRHEIYISSGQHYTNSIKTNGMRISGPTSLNFVETSYLFGNDGTFNHVIIDDDSLNSYALSVYGTNNHFKKLELNCAVCSLQTSFQADTLIANVSNQRLFIHGGVVNDLCLINGGCSGLIYLTGDLNSNASMSLSDIYLYDFNYTGPPTTISNSVDGGGNSGLTFNSPLSSRQLYWVSGQGNWTDVGHWSLTSGGAGGECVPNAGDDVFLDSNSFNTSNDTIFVDISTVSMKSIHWSDSSILFSSNNFRSKYFDMYGSFILSPGVILKMDNFYFRFFGKQQNNDIDQNGAILNLMTLDTKGPGNWKMLSDLNLSNNIWTSYFRNLYTNGYAIHTGNDLNLNQCFLDTSSIYCLNCHADTVYADSSFIYCTRGFDNSNGSFNFVSGHGIGIHNTKIKFARCESYGGNDSYIDILKIITDTSYYYNNLIAGYNDTIRYCTIEGTLDSLNGTIYFDTLAFVTPGQEVWFNSGNYTVNSYLSVNSNSSSPATTTSLKNGMIIKSSGVICIDSVEMSNMHSSGGAAFLAGASSIDLGNNSGWAFVTCGTQADINEAQQNDIVIFPNPASDFITVINPDAEKYSYKLIDSYGRIVSYGIDIKNELEISCTSFFKGIYILQLISNDSLTSISKKIVIE